MRICIINSGGTIMCTGQPLAPMPAADFAAATRRLLQPALKAALPDLDLHFDTEPRFVSPSGTRDSTDLRPADWCLIAGHVLKRYAEFDGFVILHGTDTMEFSGAALPFLLNVVDPLGIGRAVLSKPVILTGAQLPLFRETAEGLVLNAGSDAFVNLAGALACTRLRLPEVALFFAGRLWRGSRALKTSTTGFDAFESPHLPALAEAGIGVWHGSASPLPGPVSPEVALDHPDARRLAVAQLRAIAAALPDHPVMQIPILPVDHRAPAALIPRLIDAAVAEGVKGIVIEGYGEGNVPAGDGAMERSLRQADAAGVVIVICTRSIGGQVGQFHYAAGAWIAATGAISGLDMTPVAAFAKLMLLLAAADHHRWTPAILRALVRRNLVGECRDQDRLPDAGVLRPGESLSGGGAVLFNDPETGPELRGPDGHLIWSAGGPGRLEMRDGLRLIGPEGTRSTCSVPAQGAMLIVGAEGRPSLTLHDPAHRAAPVVVADTDFRR
ncbi:asparaginase domain-containing protein [Paracoccus salsus]|uniref:asparaginase domain-containing protein n=1 Tax=Paracoccus salsus TaxID=2911061 RepID=UPI001F434BB7|nr:asparaginase domain-containing protein [Paracoccus salsus]MCF3973242.1 asparaginase domain-containing protein [Paracoccus salsus]